MPNFDRSGPRGAGPMSGWARGLCARLRGAPAATGGRGAGMGWRRGGGGRGWGFGRGAGAYVPMESDPGAVSAATMSGATPEEQRAALKAERNRLKARLREVEGTLSDIGRNLRNDPDA
ncbi:MAG: DUF5320 domain-containing protein [Rhodospirillales bacterium]|nr:DUF5320 domain-containing protein [Rhodospirillales bacterium]